MWLASTEGTAAIRSEPRAFVEAFRRRIDAGLLSGVPHRRSRYEVTQIGADRLEFRAQDWATALAVGLNEVEVTVHSQGRVQYHVRFPRWGRYAVALSGVIGGVMILFLLTFDLRSYLARQSGVASLVLSEKHSVMFAWGMALFWGFTWPWILIALHRRPLRGLMERLIAEIDSHAIQHSHPARS